jgi:hypothetical protein
MKKLLLLILVSLIITEFAVCQDTTKQQLVLKFTPTALLDLYHPTIQIGIQKKYSNKFGLEFSSGLPVFWERPIHSFYSYNYGKWFPFKYKFEFQYFPGYKKKKDPKFYIAAEYYLLTGFGKNTSKDFIYFGDTAVYSCDAVRIFKIVNTICFKIGSQLKAKNVVMDYYFGLGVRSRYLKFYDFENSQFFAEHITDQPMNMSMREGNLILPHVNIGIRIGYLLKVKK